MSRSDPIVLGVAIGFAVLLGFGVVESQAGSQEPRQITVAAASSLRFVMDELVRAFQRENQGVKVRVTYGSSGNFFAQLVQQAPFDVFLSADAVYPRRLVEQGEGLRDSEFLYAVGRLILWAPSGSPVAVESKGLRSLVDPAVKKIAIANPRHAPYGRAAVEVLKNMGLYEQTREKLVFGENVAQTAQFVHSGGADVGIVAMSVVKAPSLGNGSRQWSVPPAAYTDIDQVGVILRWTLHREVAEQFRDFLLSPRGKSTFKRYGFFIPGG